MIENVSVITGDRPDILPGRYVLIRGERIASVSATRPQTAPDTPRIDGRGRYLTPGLMDSHVHLSLVPGAQLPAATSGPLHAQFVVQQPRSYLYFGVTQLLDPSNPPEAIASFEAQPLHPDLFRCGAAPLLDGYPTLFTPPPARYQFLPDYLVQAGDTRPLPPGADPAQHTPEAVVARIAATGARCVKLFIENGWGDASGWPVPSVETIRRVSRAAHQKGLLVLAHANALDMQRLALAGDVDVLAHGLWNWTGVEPGAAGVPDAIAEHPNKVREHKLGWQPTFRTVAGTRDMFVPGTLDDPSFAKVVPPALLAWYRAELGQWFKNELRHDNPGATDEQLASRIWATELLGMRATRQLSELGQPLLLASDTPPDPSYGSQPGYDTYRELQLLALAGIPLSTILAAATINNARQFRLDRDYGSVQPGKIANLLLLDANPLSSVEAWGRIDRVILHGQALERAQLAADAGVARGR